MPWDMSAGAAGACWGAWAVGTQRPSASCTMALEGHCGALLMPLACVVCEGVSLGRPLLQPLLLRDIQPFTGLCSLLQHSGGCLAAAAFKEHAAFHSAVQPAQGRAEDAERAADLGSCAAVLRRLVLLAAAVAAAGARLLSAGVGRPLHGNHVTTSDSTVTKLMSHSVTDI